MGLVVAFLGCWNSKILNLKIINLDLKNVQVERGDVSKKIDHNEQVLNRKARSHRNTKGRVVLDTIQNVHHSLNFAVSWGR